MVTVIITIQCSPSFESTLQFVTKYFAQYLVSPEHAHLQNDQGFSYCTTLLGELCVPMLHAVLTLAMLLLPSEKESLLSPALISI
jgi:hypothetical protein